MSLSFCKPHVSRKIEQLFNSHTVDLSKESSERTLKPGIAAPTISPKLHSALRRGKGPTPWLGFLRLTDTRSLPSWLLFKHSSHSKIIQALHRTRDRYEFIPNVQRQDKWVTPEGHCTAQELATHHQPLARTTPPPSRPQPHWFSLTLSTIIPHSGERERLALCRR